MFHYLVIVFFLVLGNSCTQEKFPKDIPKPKEKFEEIKAIKVLNDKWYEKITINLNDQINANEVVKSLGKKLGLRITFEKETETYINYEAKNKEFIKVLIDIFEASEKKIIIEDVNCKISNDTKYLKNYHIPYLANSRKTNNATVISNELGVKEGRSRISTENEVDFFEEVRKNLENLLYTETKEYKIFINKASNTISVHAPQKIQKLVASYLKRVITNIKKQVLVEIKIYEVNLFNKFELGINWQSAIQDFQIKKIIPFHSNNGVGIKTSNSDATKIFEFLGNFGKVQSLSNPSLVLSNNQPGIFKAVNNKVFFKFKKDQHSVNIPIFKNKTQEEATTSIVSYEVNTVSVGVTVYIQVLNNNKEETTILFKPTITEIEKEVQDPGYQIVGGRGNIPTIPEVKTRELDTVFTIKNNEQIVIGGLIYRKQFKENFNPFFFLFSNKLSNTSNKTELIFFVQAKQIEGNEEDFELSYLKED